MNRPFLLPLTASLAEGVSRFAVRDFSDVCVPARCADASVYLGEAAVAACSVSPDAFSPVCGVLPVAHMAVQNGWLCFTLTNACLDALIAAARETFPPAESDLGRYSLNRMRALARKGGSGCPPSSRARRALLLMLALPDRPGRIREAEHALLTLSQDLAPCERPSFFDQCGALADASARILYAICQKKGTIR